MTDYSYPDEVARKWKEESDAKDACIKILEEEITNSNKFAQDQEDKIAALKAENERLKSFYNGYKVDAKERKEFEDKKASVNDRVLSLEVTQRETMGKLYDKEQECERLREALKYYADKMTWRNEECDKLNSEGGFFPYDITECPIAEDHGRRARQALSAEKSAINSAESKENK